MDSNITIRPERTDDEAVVSDVVRDAFNKESTVTFVERVRKEVAFCLSLVALDGGAIVGHVIFTAVPLAIDGRQVRAAYLACASVRTTHQSRGIGSLLIREGLERLKQSGMDAALVLGHPTYYPRFGFSAALAKHIVSPWQHKPAFMALELTPGSLGGDEGVAEFHSLYTED